MSEIFDYRKSGLVYRISMLNANRLYCHL